MYSQSLIVPAVGERGTVKRVTIYELRFTRGRIGFGGSGGGYDLPQSLRRLGSAKPLRVSLPAKPL